MMWPLLLILAVFLLMPLFNKKEKHRRQRLAGLKKHDRVITTGGIYGTIAALDDDSVTLEIARDVRVRCKKSAVFDLERAPEGQSAPAPG
ncbi:MAG: preprotein translocase subunit YajC, partial [Planctomycetota bacterium]